jgi:hypothetical protein
MAITANTITVRKPPLDASPWIVSLYSTDLSDCEELKAAVAGKCHYIRKITIFCASAITISIGGGETTDELTAIYLGPIPFAATSSQYVIEFPDDALVVAKATALCIDASGAGVAAVIAEGWTGQAFS